MDKAVGLVDNLVRKMRKLLNFVFTQNKLAVYRNVLPINLWRIHITPYNI